MTVDTIVVDDPSSLPASADQFLDWLAGPTILRLRGRDPTRTRVVAGLLHGNEPSGLHAIHALVRTVIPAVDVLFFIGAVAAARAWPRLGHRMLPGARDLNRCFRPPFVEAEGQLAEAVLTELRAAHPEAVVDLHNNSGHNPAYAIGSGIDGSRLAVAALFAERYVVSEVRLGTFSEAFEDVAPSVTIECGRSGDPAADAIARAGLERFLRLEHLDPVVTTPERLRVYSDVVRVTLRPGLRVAFAAEPTSADLTLDPEIDRHNFEILAAGTHIGWARPQPDWPLAAIDGAGVDRSRTLFAIGSDGALTIRQTFTPIMMTTDPVAARADCLFYAVHQRA